MGSRSADPFPDISPAKAGDFVTFVTTGHMGQILHSRMDIATVSDVVKRYNRIFALAGLLPVDSGTIELLSHPQGPGRADLKRRIGLVTQVITVFEDLLRSPMKRNHLNTF